VAKNRTKRKKYEGWRQTGKIQWLSAEASVKTGRVSDAQKKKKKKKKKKKACDVKLAKKKRVEKKNPQTRPQLCKKRSR